MATKRKKRPKALILEFQTPENYRWFQRMVDEYPENYGAFAKPEPTPGGGTDKWLILPKGNRVRLYETLAMLKAKVLDER
jgi:hypothetical protein